MRLALAEESLEDAYLYLSDDASYWRLWQRELSRNPKLRKTVKHCFPRMGDWDCAHCSKLNFSRNDLCFFCGTKNSMAEAEAEAARAAFPNDEGSQFYAQREARAARQPEAGLTENEPKPCAYYKWLERSGEAEFLPNWVYYNKGGGGNGESVGGGDGAGSGDGGGGWSWDSGLEEQACEYGGGSDSSVDFDSG
jgi:hypothetical protein